MNDKCVKGYNPNPDLGAADYCECNVGDDNVCQHCKGRTCACSATRPMPAGAEAGITIGAIAIVGFIAFGVYHFVRRRRTGGLMSEGAK